MHPHPQPKPALRAGQPPCGPGRAFAMPLDPACARARQAIMRGNPVDSAHLADCPICREQLEQFGTAILSPHADEIPCAELRAQLPTLLSEAPPDSPSDAEALTRARAHLDRCPECQAEHQAAQAALIELSQPDPPLPPTPPTFDTRFLRPTPWRRFSPLPTTLTILTLALIIATCAILLRPDDAAPTPSTANPPSPQTAPTTPAALALAATPIPRATAPTLLHSATSTRIPSFSPTSPPSPPPPTRSPLPSPTTAPSATPILPPPPSDDDDDEPPHPTPSPTTPMQVICDLDRFGPVGNILQSDCRDFAAGQSFDLFHVDVTEASRWTFTLCARTELDTLLALYPATGFQPGTPCANLIAYDDDHCGRQSRLELDLPAGRYLLLLTEKSGDLSGNYTIQVRSSAHTAPQACPLPTTIPQPTEPPTTPLPTSTEPVPPTPTATASPSPPQSPAPGTPSPTP